MRFVLIFFLTFTLNAETVSVMTFNVENLFDNKDDPDRVDETYIALKDKQTAKHLEGCNLIEVKSWRDSCLYLDWNDEVIDIKLQNLSTVILSEDVDIIGLQEVENIGMLERLYNRVKQNGYVAYDLIEGQDERGIDLGIISKFPIKESILHRIEFAGVTTQAQRDTRGVYEVTLDVRGKDFKVFVVHFPAGHHASSMRKDAFKSLNKIASKTTVPAVAVGDFNVNSTEDKAENIYRDYASPIWKISHVEGCADCLGSTFYFRNRTWSYLDSIMVLRNSGAEFIPETIKVVKHPLQTDNEGFQIRFDQKRKRGVSDHFPVVAEIVF